MFTKFTAQNFDGDLYSALDLSRSGAHLFYSKNGDISLLKRFIQLMWASTAEDGIGTTFTLNSIDHKLTSTVENIYLDDSVVRLSEMEKAFDISFVDYSKIFLITYTQLLNLELARIQPENYLNQYAFHKADSKSYYSPLEDVFYDIEQARRYSGETVMGAKDEDVLKSKELKISDIKNKIQNLQQQKETGIVVSHNNIDQEIINLQQLIDNQKIQDEFLIQKEQLEREMDNLSKKVRQYEDSMSKVSKVDIDMSKYEKFGHLNVQRVENDLATFAYRIREREKLFTDMGNRKIAYVDDSKHLIYLPVIVLLTLTVAVGVTLSIFENVFLGLSIGITVIIAIILYFILHKSPKINKEAAITHDKVAAITNEIDALRSAKIRYLQNLGFNNEDDYYATKALFRALAFQKETDLAAIHELYDGKELSDFKSIVLQKRNLLNDLQIEIDKYGPIMSPEEYIKKRRDLDLLKLEKSQNLSNLSGDETNIDEKIEVLQNELSELTIKTQDSIDPIIKFKEILSEYYQKDFDVEGDFILKNAEVSNYEQKVEMLIIQRLAYILAKFQSVEIPLFLEDPFVGVENKDLIKKILIFCSSKVQTILISEHKEYEELGLNVINT